MPYSFLHILLQSFNKFIQQNFVEPLLLPGIVWGNRAQQWTETKSPGYMQLQLMMSFSFNVLRVGISFVIMCIVYKAAVNSLPELSPQQYLSTLQAGKASLAYFYQAGKYFLYSDFYDISIAI